MSAVRFDVPLKCKKCQIRAETTLVEGEGYNIRCVHCNVSIVGVEAENVVLKCWQYLNTEKLEKLSGMFILDDSMSFCDFRENFLKPKTRFFELCE